ncbi:DUF389 domain-containing protein [Sphingomonas changnyeongensis]|uniref:DUF389 domain-containing protein n=1 Tax=Sphingomonas changnyeongensis TaxID=2698679 RepID=A0A7Z2NTE7_9SPHN|nr:DUF389 domain-containing protein [Sphingomonas changnyeongensis]QHL89508.1 DUF389 domain-containing protein [Sphingomonas changnyeongensis]
MTSIDALEPASAGQASAGQAGMEPAGDRRSFAGFRQRMTRGVRHDAVLATVERDAVIGPPFLFMTVMSAGVAILGLLQSSPAVVIGAMLISPLMGPILGLGFGLALFDSALLRRALMALAAGIALAVSFAALVVLMSPLTEVTPEIAARTRPNLFDLIVAMLSGLAAAYALIRGLSGTLVGVGIAVAVMPPLATVGFGLATGNMAIAGGAAFLFFTNLMAISLSAAALARLYRFGHKLSERQTWLQAGLIVAVFAGLSVPLGLSLGRIAQEAVAARQIRDAIAAEFADKARIAQLAIDHDSRPLRVSATVFTPELRTDAASRAEAAITARLGYPVDVALDQVRVGSGAPDAAQLAAARAEAAESAEQQVRAQLALVAGAPPEALLVDPQRRVARARAALLPGATLAAYQMLEARAAAALPGWTVIMAPPVDALPALTDAPLDEQADALALIAWASARLERPVRVAGEGADALAARLAERGAEVEQGAMSGALRLGWAGDMDTGAGSPGPK